MKNIEEVKYYFSWISMAFSTILVSSISLMFFTFLYFSITGIYTLAILIACFFAFLLILILPKYFQFTFSLITNKPALILTSEELIDNINNQKFKWAEIESITLKTHKGRNPGTYLAVRVMDPNKFIKADPNPFRQLIKHLDTKYWGGTFSIPHNNIKCKSSELLDNLRFFQQNYKKQS